MSNVSVDPLPDSTELTDDFAAVTDPTLGISVSVFFLDSPDEIPDDEGEINEQSVFSDWFDAGFCRRAAALGLVAPLLVAGEVGGTEVLCVVPPLAVADDRRGVKSVGLRLLQGLIRRNEGSLQPSVNFLQYVCSN